ncbi:MAG: hypothetical protein KY468_17450 [Armatimonadetes bacterium]|nr:hypothetical protein [Armatimonadota bacterium]
MPDGRFGHQKYLIRRKFFRIFGGAFYVDGPDGSLLLYGEMKAFKLKEDIRIYTGLEKAEEVLTIKARQMLDFAAAYDVFDSSTGEKVGVLKRKGLKSLLKDEWVVMDAADREIGTIQEDRMLLALIRRFVPMGHFIPQLFRADIGGSTAGYYRQLFHLFLLKMEVDFTPDVNGALDRRLGVAAGILLGAIEGKQQ